MSIKLNAQSGGSVALDAPTQTQSSADLTFKLPVADGSTNQALKTDGSGNLSFGAAGLFSSYAIIADVKSNLTSGGTFTAGAWQTRDLNTEIADSDSIVSISSNQFTLAACSYLIKARCPAFNTNAHQSRLYNVSDSNVEQVGTTSFVNSNSGHVVTDSFCLARVTISGSKTFEIQHYAAVTSATYGFGVGGNMGNSMIYTTVEIYKEA